MVVPRSRSWICTLLRVFLSIGYSLVSHYNMGAASRFLASQAVQIGQETIAVASGARTPDQIVMAAATTSATTAAMTPAAATPPVPTTAAMRVAQAAMTAAMEAERQQGRAAIPAAVEDLGGEIGNQVLAALPGFIAGASVAFGWLGSFL